MRFAHFEYIYFLIPALAALGIFYIWAAKSRQKALERFSQKELLKELLAGIDPAKRSLKAGLIISVFALSFLALLGPQWGFQWQEVRRKGLDILIALDTSKSMLTRDVLPSRLERSKLAIRDLTKSLKGDRIGLIAFAGSAFLQCPLTVDYSGFLLSLDSIDINTIPKGGTSISSAIREGLSGFAAGEKKYQTLVIITDGEDHALDVEQAAQEAKKQGVTIYCIGIGTKEGELIPLNGESGKTGFLKDRQGNVVKSQLDEDLLQRIALTTGGSYVRSTSLEFGLELLYREKFSKMEKKDLKGKMAKHYQERFQVPLAVALILLLWESFVRTSRIKQYDEKN